MNFLWVETQKRLIQAETADSCCGVFTDPDAEVSWVWLAQNNFISQAGSLAKVKEYSQLSKKVVRVEGMWASCKLYYVHLKMRNTGHLAKPHLAKYIRVFWPSTRFCSECENNTTQILYEQFKLKWKYTINIFIYPGKAFFFFSFASSSFSSSLCFSIWVPPAMTLDISPSQENNYFNSTGSIQRLRIQM